MNDESKGRKERFVPHESEQFPLRRMGSFHRLFAVQGQRMIAKVMSMLDELYVKMDLPNKAFTVRKGEGL